MSDGNTMCHAEFPCLDDQDEPCLCPFIGPRRRRTPVRYSARFVQQMRELGGDPRFPLRLTAHEATAVAETRQA